MYYFGCTCTVHIRSRLQDKQRLDHASPFHLSQSLMQLLKRKLGQQLVEREAALFPHAQKLRYHDPRHRVPLVRATVCDAFHQVLGKQESGDIGLRPRTDRDEGSEFVKGGVRDFENALVPNAVQGVVQALVIVGGQFA